MKKILFVSSLLAFAIPSMSRAALITVTSSSILLDTQNQSVNAVELHLTFPPRVFAVEEMNDAGSAIGLWVSSPAVSNNAGTLDFSGIVPGGIETRNGVLVRFRITPQIGGPVAASFAVSGVKVLLNDGRGSPAAATVISPPFSLAAAALNPTPAAAVPDLRAPSHFLPEIATSSDLFGGKYFLVFAATDQGSGIDHYEVMEVPTGGGGTIGGWHAATSPYLIEDQSLASDIYVRAVNRAGNFRVVEITAPFPARAAPQSVISPWFAAAAGFAILLVGGLFILFLWFLRRKKYH